MNKIIIVLTIFLLLSQATARGAEIKYVDIQDNPESELCKDMKEVVGDGGYVIVDANKERERLPNRPLGTEKIVFQNDSVGKFSFIRDGKVTETNSNYFILDINNDGEKDYFRVISGGHYLFGESSNMEIYKNNWTLLKQPIDNKLAFDIKAIVGTASSFHMQALKVGDIELLAYHIYIFKWNGNNYLLLQRHGWDGIDGVENNDKSYYIVAELGNDYQLFTHCFYVNDIKQRN